MSVFSVTVTWAESADSNGADIASNFKADNQNTAIMANAGEKHVNCSSRKKFLHMRVDIHAKCSGFLRSIDCSIGITSTNSTNDPDGCETSADDDLLSTETPVTSEASSVDPEIGDEARRLEDTKWPQESQETFNASFCPQIRQTSPKNQSTPSATNMQKAKIQEPTTSNAPAEKFPEDFDEDLPVAPEEVAHAIAFRDRILQEWSRGGRNPSIPLTVSVAAMMTGADYLDATVGPLLAQGLAEILKRRPKNPVEFLAAYLLADQVRMDAKIESRIEAAAGGGKKPAGPPADGAATVDVTDNSDTDFVNAESQDEWACWAGAGGE